MWVEEAKAFSCSQAGTVPGSSLSAIQRLVLGGHNRTSPMSVRLGLPSLPWG